MARTTEISQAAGGERAIRLSTFATEELHEQIGQVALGELFRSHMAYQRVDL